MTENPTPTRKRGRPSAHDRVGKRRTNATPLRDLIETRVSRRAALTGMTALATLGAMGVPLGNRAQAAPSSLTFEELQRIYDHDDHVAPGHSKQVLIRWGEPLSDAAPAFDPGNLTAAGQEMQFGYNADYIAYVPLPMGSNSSDHGLICVNHEYPSPQLMWHGFDEDGAGAAMTKDQVDVTLAAHGLSVVEVKKVDGDWQVVPNGSYNRRISMSTPMAIHGPAAGHDWMKTSDDPSGTRVIGMHDNCAGGMTPWHTVLTCEEGSGWYFGGEMANTPHAEFLERNYFYDGDDYYGWGRFYDRLHVEKEPNEYMRYEYVVEIDPFDPNSTPVKRTSMGRFGHEGATTVLNKDGRVVVYLGDDWENEYIYKFVTNDTFNPDDREANRDMLDDGVLYAARLDDDGSLTWVPMVQGEGPLTPENGFASQGDISIKTRQAADLLGATPMDRPEDIEASPVTGRVYVALTNNEIREPDKVDAANPRAENLMGHIVELIPPGEPGADADHAATHYTWQIFILGGDPADPAHQASYHPDVSANGWLVNPDNLTFDPTGRLWIATDGANDLDMADGLYGVDTEGPGRALPKLLYAAPFGAEVAGPIFTPDGQTLFLSVQHPGEDSDILDNVTTRWPDFDEKTPPRPSVIVITRDGGGMIGS